MQRQSKLIYIGNCPVGGGSPVSIQSMTNTDTRNVQSSLEQIKALAAEGCDIIRLAVPDMTAAEALCDIKANSPIPIVADIHFDYRLALAAINSNVDAVRINPGNIGDAQKVQLVAEAAGNHNIPIRIGANSGSLSEAIRTKYLTNKHVGDEQLSDALVESALEQCQILEKFGFSQIKVSLKASSVPTTVMAYRKFAQRSDYPLHLGVTEAGTPKCGIIKSAIGIGTLLLDGIGDTIRVSLTADPLAEVSAAKRILESCNLRQAKPDLVSCPTCGRTEINLIGLAERTEELIESIKRSGKKLNLNKIAVMGCIVNGPGEAKDAELGIAGGKNKIVVFKSGEIIGTFDEITGFEFFKEQLNKFIEN